MISTVSEFSPGLSSDDASDDGVLGDLRPDDRPRIRELPSEDRPRERLIAHGANALSAAELLAVLLRTGSDRTSALGLAERLLGQCGGLRGLAGASLDEMSAVRGIGPAKGVQLLASIEIGRRLSATRGEDRPRIRSPRDVYDLLGPALRDEKREHFVALLLDTRNAVLARKTISVGDLSSAIVHPREVYREAIRHAAASIIVAHNHPSGDPSPSVEDIATTRRLAEAGQVLGIDLLDHIILGEGRWLSLKEKAIL